jgi:hypothetical protein
VSPREELHKLVDGIPDAEVEYARKLLAGLCAQPNESAEARSIEEIAAEFAARVPPEAWDELPADLTDQLDHYIYGTPKR